MAKTLPQGQRMWVAMSDEYFEVEILERGTAGHVFKTGKKPKNPYVVRDVADEDVRFIVGYENLHDSPVEASIEMAQLAKAKKLTSNPSGPGDEDEDESEDEETDPGSDDDDAPEDDTILE